MNYIDIIIIILIAWLGYKGLKNGLIKELAGIVAISLGIVLAIKLSTGLARLLSDFEISSSDYLPVISFALIFIAVVIITHSVSAIVDKVVKIIRLNWLNKIAGMIFAVVKTTIILSVIFFLINQFLINIIPHNFVALNNSILYQPISEIVYSLFPYIEEINRSNFISLP